MRQPLTFFVQGIPAGQPRIKASSRGGFVRCYTPTTVKKSDGSRKPHPAATWKKAVREAAKSSFAGALFEQPICLNLTFYLPRPKSHFRSNGELKPNVPKWHTTKPDRDNLEKLVNDALTFKQMPDETKPFGVWTDDNLVCDGKVRKLYTQTSGLFANVQCASGVEIEIKEAGE
jgi:Holliday junction resolvase RusA-like endonuclease